MFATRFQKLSTVLVGFLTLLALVASSFVTAPTASAAVPPDVTSYTASGKYLKKLSGYKIGLYIPKNKKNGTDLGTTKLVQHIMGANVTFKVKFERANSARLNVTMYQTPSVMKYLNNSDTKRHIEVYCYAVKLGSKWKYVDPDTGKAYFSKVEGKKFTFQAKFYAVLKQYDLDNDVWVVQEKGAIKTPVQTVSWVKKK